MTRLRELTVTAMPAVTVALIAWIWLGRIVFGLPIGWLVIVGWIYPLPVLAGLLTITSVLAHRQRRGPPRLSTPQTLVQLVLWAALFICGTALPDYTDGPELPSILQARVGTSAEAAAAVFSASAWVAGGAWLLLLILLIAGRRSRPVLPPTASVTGHPGEGRA
jgi:hypothetical protein